MHTFFQNILQNSIKISWFMTKLTIPIMILVKAVSEIGGITFLATLLSPIMFVFGLPGEAGLAWASAIIANIYVSLNVFSSLEGLQNLTIGQATTFGLLVLIMHNIFMETTVMLMLRLRLVFAISFRFLSAIFIAYVFAKYIQITQTYTTPSTSFVPVQNLQVDFWTWVQNQGLLLLGIYVIIISMVILLETLKILKITDIIVWMVSPVLRLLGVSKNAGEITMIGLLLGLAYGGAFFIEQNKKGNITHREIVICICFIGLAHALIEDTLLLTLIGADIFILLVYRTLISFCIIWGLATIIHKCSDTIFYRIFFTKSNKIKQG